MNAPKRSKALVTASGRDYAEWFDLLDRWGAPGRPYPEIAEWLTGQGLSAWWAQKLIIEYEQSRGVRRAGARPDGSYTAGASKTIVAPAESVFAAFADPAIRGRWLPQVALTERRANPPRSAHFDLADGSGRLQLTVATTAAGKLAVAVEHSGLTDPDAVEQTKRDWRQRLSSLKDLLES